jgi:hypothetical protein
VVRQVDVVVVAGVAGRIGVQGGTGEPGYGVGQLVLGVRGDLVRLQQ